MILSDCHNAPVETRTKKDRGNMTPVYICMHVDCWKECTAHEHRAPHEPCYIPCCTGCPNCQNHMKPHKETLEECTAVNPICISKNPATCRIHCLEIEQDVQPHPPGKKAERCYGNEICCTGCPNCKHHMKDVVESKPQLPSQRIREIAQKGKTFYEVDRKAAMIMGILEYLDEWLGESSEQHEEGEK